jgi:hypothetical protein
MNRNNDTDALRRICALSHMRKDGLPHMRQNARKNSKLQKYLFDFLNLQEQYVHPIGNSWMKLKQLL